MNKGIRFIATERDEQINKHGRTIELDVAENNSGQLRVGAMRLLYTDTSTTGYPTGWDPKIWDKMRNKSQFDRLVIAGALIAAELDRLVEAMTIWKIDHGGETSFIIADSHETAMSIYENHESVKLVDWGDVKPSKPAELPFDEWEDWKLGSSVEDADPLSFGDYIDMHPRPALFCSTLFDDAKSTE